MTFADQGFDKLLNRASDGADGSFATSSGQVSSSVGSASNEGTYNSVTEEVDPLQLSSGSVTAQLTIDRDGHIKGGATGYLEGDGFWIGSYGGSLTDYRFFIGDSAGDYLSYANGVLTVTGAITAGTIDIGGSDSTSFHVDADGNMWLGAATFAAATFSVSNAGVVTAASGAIGGFSIGTDYIRDAANSFGLASTVTGGDDVRFWAGDTFANRASAPFRVTESGITTVGNTTDFVSYNGTIIQANGKLVAQDRSTTGHAIDQGDAVSSESGTLYRTRVNNYSAEGTATTLTINPMNASTTNKPGRFIDVSSTVKLILVATGNTTNDITAARVVCSPSSSSITSATASVAINTTANITADCDGVLFDTNRVFAVYTNAAGGGIYAKVLSGLDSGITTNTEATVAATCNERCAVVKVSSTEVLVIYTDGNDNIVATSCTIDGANAITVGSTQTILSDANVLQVRWAERFGSTTCYAVNFYDSTNVVTYAIAFTYSGGSYSIGSQTSVSNSLTRMSMASMGDNAMVMVGSALAYGMTRSGTTLTVGSVTAIGAGNFMYVARMGKGNAVVAWRHAANDIRYQAIDMDTTARTITLLGSAGSIDTTGGDDFVPMIVKLSPTRAVAFRDGTVANDEKVAVVDWSTNYGVTVGIAAATVATATSLLVVQAGTSDDVTGLTVSTEYFVDCGGGLTTSTLGGTKHIGVTWDSTTELIVQLAG